ncbi:MAG: penicillin-binding transpeptidase domain-containing protein, partial [Bradyrhizobium sp.]
QPDRSDVTALMAMSRNRIVTDTFEPGSIFKIITLAAALDSGAVTMDSTFECSGSLRFRTESIKCWKRGGHGHQTLAEACQNSCNCAFMQMALAMGVDTFYDYIYAFGFGSKTSSGVPGEDTGDVIHRKYIRDTDLARIGFGQSITVTPLQMVNAAAAAINGGILWQPYIIDSITTNEADGTSVVIEHNEPKELRRVIQSETSEKVRLLLQSVVDHGSGSNAQTTAAPSYEYFASQSGPTTRRYRLAKVRTSS